MAYIAVYTRSRLWCVEMLFRLQQCLICSQKHWKMDTRRTVLGPTGLRKENSIGEVNHPIISHRRLSMVISFDIRMYCGCFVGTFFSRGRPSFPSSMCTAHHTIWKTCLWEPLGGSSHGRPENVTSGVARWWRSGYDRALQVFWAKDLCVGEARVVYVAVRFIDV